MIYGYILDLARIKKFYSLCVLHTGHKHTAINFVL